MTFHLILNRPQVFWWSDVNTIKTKPHCGPRPKKVIGHPCPRAPVSSKFCTFFSLLAIYDSFARNGLLTKILGLVGHFVRHYFVRHLTVRFSFVQLHFVQLYFVQLYFVQLHLVQLYFVQIKGMYFSYKYFGQFTKLSANTEHHKNRFSVKKVDRNVPTYWDCSIVKKHIDFIIRGPC